MKLLSLLIFVSALSLRAGTISIVVGKSIAEDGCSIARTNSAFQSDRRMYAEKNENRGLRSDLANLSTAAIGAETLP